MTSTPTPATPPATPGGELAQLAEPAVVNNRGSVRVYAGSLAELVGRPIIGLDDCECSECVQLDPWSPARRYRVSLVMPGWPAESSFVLDHVRPTSVIDPLVAS